MNIEITYQDGKELLTKTIFVPVVSGELWEDVARFFGWKENMKKPCDPMWYISQKNIKRIKRVKENDRD